MRKEPHGIPIVALSFPEALDCIRRSFHRLPAEEVPLTEAQGRILVAALTSPVAIPPVANSAMDGYALSELSADEQGFTLLAAPYPTPDSREPFAVRVQTGHPVPTWAACVVAEEHSRFAGDRIFTDSHFPDGQNIRPVGEDIQAGSLLFPTGNRLDPVALMRFASAGIDKVSVTRKPRVAILTTGDELVRGPALPHPVAPRFECDSVLVAGLVRELGGDPILLPHLPDDLDVIREELRNLPECDLLITCGGAANSELDHIRPALKQLGGKFQFERVHMKPARPSGFGFLGERPVFTLPGNPVAVFVSFQVLVKPALIKMMGGNPDLSRRRFALSGCPIAVDPRRHQFQRVSLEWTETSLLAHAYQEAGSGLIRSLIDCDGLIGIPAGTSIEAGQSVEIVWMRP